MTEYQKMLGGQLYNAQDGELQAMHRTAMELCHALNQLNPNQKEEARALLQQLLGRTGEHFTIKSTFWCDYGRHITIGENFFCNYNCVMLDCAPITFGDNVMVAPNCGFYTAAHPLDHTSGTRSWSTPSPSPWGTAFGSAGASLFCPASPSAAAPSSAGAAWWSMTFPRGLWPSATPAVPSAPFKCKKGTPPWGPYRKEVNTRQKKLLFGGCCLILISPTTRS